MIRNVWLIMATHCLFLSCNNSYNICPYVKFVKIGFLFLFQKKKRTENVKMLLQNNCINNGVTNGLKKKQKKKACKAALYGKTRKVTGFNQVSASKLLGD